MSYQNELNHAFLRVESSLISLHAMKVAGMIGDVLKDQNNGMYYHTYFFLLILYLTAVVSTGHVTYITILIPSSLYHSSFSPSFFIPPTFL